MSRSHLLLSSLILLSACQAPQPLSQSQSNPSAASSPSPQPVSTRSPGPDQSPSPAPDKQPAERRPEDYTDAEVTARTQSLTPQLGLVSPDGRQLLMRYSRERKVSFRDGKKLAQLEAHFMLLDLSSGQQQAVDMPSFWMTNLQVWEDSSRVLHAPPVIISDLPQAGSTVMSLDPATGLSSERIKLADGEVVLSLDISGETLYLLTSKGIQARQHSSGALLRSYTHPFPAFYSFFSGFELLHGTRKALVSVDKDRSKEGTQPFKAQMTQPPLSDYYLLDLVSGAYTPVHKLLDTSFGPRKPVQVSPDGQFLLLALGQTSSVLDLQGNPIAETESIESAWISADSVVTLYVKDNTTRLQINNLRSALTLADTTLSGSEPVLVESRDGQILVQLTQNGQRVLQAFDLRQPDNIPAPKTLLSFPADGRIALINGNQRERRVSVLAMEFSSTSQTLYRWDPINNNLVNLLDLRPTPVDFRYQPKSGEWHFSN